jgi:hypothetical protein
MECETYITRSYGNIADGSLFVNSYRGNIVLSPLQAQKLSFQLSCRVDKETCCQRDFYRYQPALSKIPKTLLSQRLCTSHTISSSHIHRFSNNDDNPNAIRVNIQPKNLTSALSLRVLPERLIGRSVCLSADSGLSNRPFSTRVPSHHFQLSELLQDIIRKSDNCIRKALMNQRILRVKFRNPVLLDRPFYHRRIEAAT